MNQISLKIAPLVIQESSQNTKKRGLHIVYHKNAQNIIICIKVTCFKYNYSGGVMGYFQKKTPCCTCVCCSWWCPLTWQSCSHSFCPLQPTQELGQSRTGSTLSSSAPITNGISSRWKSTWVNRSASTKCAQWGPHLHWMDLIPDLSCHWSIHEVHK